MARLTLAAAVLLGLATGALSDLQTCGQAQYDPEQVSLTTVALDSLIKRTATHLLTGPSHLACLLGQPIPLPHHGG